MSHLKDIYTEDFLLDFAYQLVEFQPDFTVQAFIREVFADEWETLTLRPRMQKIATLLGVHLNGDYHQQMAIILALHRKNTGFNYLFLPDFVAIYGLNSGDFNESLAYLKSLTPYSSAEFAIRSFILKDDERVLPTLLEWSLDADEHVRRLASEGLRPRLPWGIHLKKMIAEPEHSLPLLTNLRNDPSLYVRKSVANHLNDHAKAHPDFVLDICESWQGVSSQTDWIIKRACRTLLKNAEPRALALFGYQAPGISFEIITVNLTPSRSTITIGEKMAFDYQIKTTISASTPIKLEYGIHYIKANGKPRLKKFHLAEGIFTCSVIKGRKSLAFNDLSTRKHYPGEHKLSLYLNGVELNCATIRLT